MINLIKNELIKIISKKTFIFFIIIPILFLLTICSIYKYNNSSSNNKINKYQKIAKKISNKNLKETELLYIINNKTKYETLRLKKNYNKTSWQYYYIDNYISKLIKEYNITKYQKKDQEKTLDIEQELNNSINILKNKTWQYLIKKEIQKQNSNSLYLKSLKYRLKLGIPFSYTINSKIVEDYLKYGNLYYSSTNNKDKQLSREKYLEAKYKLDHKILSYSKDISINEQLMEELKYPIIIIVIFCIIISGTILAEEFSKGTIKSLLIRPFSRKEILIAKYSSLLIIILFYIIYYFIINIVIYGLFFEFKDLTVPIVIYNLTNESFSKINIIIYCLKMIFLSLPYYFLIALIAFCIGLIFKNSTISFVSSLIIYFISETIKNNTKIIKYFNLNSYYFPNYLNNDLILNYNIKKLVVVYMIVYIIMILGSIKLFKKIDIKNQ